MKELIVTAWCDMCWLEDRKTPSVQMYRVAITGGARPMPPKETEWCAEHLPMATALLALYERAAVTEEPQPAPRERASDAEESVACPVCGSTYTMANRVISHIRKVHRGNEPLYPADSVCEVCGQPCTSSTGLAAHLRGTHHIDLVARAAEPVLARARLKRERAG